MPALTCARQAFTRLGVSTPVTSSTESYIPWYWLNAQCTALVTSDSGFDERFMREHGDS